MSRKKFRDPDMLQDGSRFVLFVTEIPNVILLAKCVRVCELFFNTEERKLTEQWGSCGDTDTGGKLTVVTDAPL